MLTTFYNNKWFRINYQSCRFRNNKNHDSGYPFYFSLNISFKQNSTEYYYKYSFYFVYSPNMYIIQCSIKWFIIHSIIYLFIKSILRSQRK